MFTKKFSYAVALNKVDGDLVKQAGVENGHAQNSPGFSMGWSPYVWPVSLNSEHQSLPSEFISKYMWKHYVLTILMVLK